MATDPWGTDSDGLYIVSSVRGASANGDFSSAFYQGIFIKILANTMTLVKYSYFNLGVDNTAYDIFVSNFGRYITHNIYTT